MRKLREFAFMLNETVRWLDVNLNVVEGEGSYQAFYGAYRGVE